MKCGEEMRSVINISRARDKEKIWIPDINRTYMTYRTPVGCSNHWATLDLYNIYKAYVLHCQSIEMFLKHSQS